MFAVPRHFITCNDVTGNYSTTSVRARARELFVALTALHFSILFWLELQGTLQYAYFEQEKEQNKRNYIENLESRKEAARASYLIVLNQKRKRLPAVLVIMLVLRRKGPSRASYRADPEEKRGAFRVASRASGLLTARSSI